MWRPTWNETFLSMPAWRMRVLSRASALPGWSGRLGNTRSLSFASPRSGRNDSVFLKLSDNQYFVNYICGRDTK